MWVNIDLSKYRHDQTGMVVSWCHIMHEMMDLWPFLTPSLNITVWTFDLSWLHLWISLRGPLTFPDSIFEYHCVDLWPFLTPSLNITSWTFDLSWLHLWISLCGPLTFPDSIFEYHCVDFDLSWLHLWISLYQIVILIIELNSFVTLRHYLTIVMLTLFWACKSK